MKILPNVKKNALHAALVMLTLVLTGCPATSNDQASNKNEEEAKSGFLSSILASGGKIMSGVLLGDEGDISERAKNAAYQEVNDKASETISNSVNEDRLRTLSSVVLVVPADQIEIRNRKTYGGATMFTASTKDGRSFRCVLDAKNLEIKGSNLVECSSN